MQKQTVDMKKLCESETDILSQTKEMFDFYEKRLALFKEEGEKLNSRLKVVDIENAQLFKQLGDNEVFAAQMDVSTPRFFSKQKQADHCLITPTKGCMKFIYDFVCYLTLNEWS